MIVTVSYAHYLLFKQLFENFTVQPLPAPRGE